MDDTIKNDEGTDKNGDISLGAGVGIVKENHPIDDVEFESYNDNTDGDGTMSPEDRIKKLRNQLKDAVREKQEYLDGWQRLKADFVNFKKREEEGKDEFIKFARENLVVDLLPVLESFHMAFANKDAWEKVDASWRKGVEYIHTQLTQVLQGHGLVVEDPIGKDFNPNEHTAIATVPTKESAKFHKVAEVVQLGYRLSGKLIKSPKVKIFGEEESGSATSPDQSK